MVITTSNADCTLRPWDPADKAHLIENANDRAVWRNLTDMFPHPYTGEDADRWFAVAGSSCRSTHLAIVLNGEAAGGIGVIADDGVYRSTGHFGYWLGQRYWGRGIATAAARAFAYHLQEQGSFRRLQAVVFEWNPASMRVLEKCGFIREATLRNSVTKDGSLIDSAMYALVFD